MANQRIGEEIRLIPKATRAGPGGRKKQLPDAVNGFGRTATGIPGTSRSRLGKLADLPKPELTAMATRIQEAGGGIGRGLTFASRHGATILQRDWRKRLLGAPARPGLPPLAFSPDKKKRLRGGSAGASGWSPVGAINGSH